MKTDALRELVVIMAAKKEQWGVSRLPTCIVVTIATHICDTKTKTDALCSHASSCRCFGQSGHGQRAGEGHIWGCATAGSHFLLLKRHIWRAGEQLAQIVYRWQGDQHRGNLLVLAPPFTCCWYFFVTINRNATSCACSSVLIIKIMKS